MGRVMNRIRLTNANDHANVLEGRIPPEEMRSVELDALVDTGAMLLAIPEEAAAALGVSVLGVETARLADGSPLAVRRVGPIRLEILGRHMSCDALVLPTGTITLIGQIPLEALHLIVDPAKQELRLAPGEPIMDLLAAV